MKPRVFAMPMPVLFYGSFEDEDCGLPPRFSAFIHCDGVGAAESGAGRSTVVHYVLRDAHVLIAVACGLN